MTRGPGRALCLLAVGALLSLTWMHSVRRTASDVEIQTLHKRLLAIEAVGDQVNQELHRALKNLGNLSRSTQTTQRPTSITTGEPRRGLVASGVPTTLLLPNIFSFLPHLKEHADSLTPNVVLGQGRRGVSLVLGVPTVRREKQTYLINTLGSLLNNLTPAQCQDLLIIIFVAETDPEFVHSVADNISRSFPNEASSGLLEVVSPPLHYYPKFSTIQETLGDSKERVKWRTKQTLDFSFLMLYAQDKGTYYVQLEDDIVTTTGYYKKMKDYAVQQSSGWMFLEFSQLGFIGKMFHAHDLQMIAEFFLMFHRDKPVDWLLDHILWVKVCSPEKDAKHCQAQKALMKRRHKPSLFQHIGLHSSLSGKLQNLKDKDFVQHFSSHINPPATVSTSLVHYKLHTLDRAYQGKDFFWGFTPVRGDHATIRFAQPTNIKRYLFRSGNSLSHLDKFYNTTVEVLPSNATMYKKLTVGSPPQYTGSDDGFIVIGDFQGGIAQGNISEVLQPISSMRLLVHTDSDVWVALSEVLIEV